MEFRVLGPVEARDGDRTVALGGRRQRALLALLLLHANESVNGERVALGLWGEEAPAGAGNTVQVYVSRLRRALDDPDRVATTAAGYRLCVAPGELDAERFERLVLEARGELGSGDATRARELLGEALGLWRGPALAELSAVPFAGAEIARLEEQRLAALESRVEADLAIGRHAELIGELRQLTATHPLRERLHGQLMLALYRNGRQADALDAYRRARDLLVDQLGIEPGNELAELQRAILAHDASIDAPHDAPRSRAVGGAAPGPQTRLPVAATPFVGRARELGEVTVLLQRPGTRLLTLTGAGGIGKTRLALRVAETCAERFRDGVCFVGFGDATAPELIAPMICQALGVVEQTGPVAPERLAEWLKERELLLVLDNLEQLVEGTAMLGSVLSACPSLTMLATSREPLHLAVERQYEVPVLERDDAVALFSERAQAVIADLNMDLRLAQLICQRLDFLPLSIELAAARTKALALAEILSRLDARLPLLTGGPRDAPRRQRTLRATIDWSYELLNSDEQQLFARLGVFAGGFTFVAAEAVCAARLDTVQSLVDRSLLGSDGARYRMLQTLREYALERLEETGEANDMRRLHYKWFADLLDAEALETAFPNWSKDWRTSALAQEGENLRAALAWALKHGQWRGWKRTD